VIRSTPTGVSAIVDARGRVLHSLPWRTAGVIDGDVPMRTVAPTIFARAGNLIPLALGFALIIAGIVLGSRRRYRTEI
jgi:apolipoprotein N-acyltransferase